MSPGPVGRRKGVAYSLVRDSPMSRLQYQRKSGIVTNRVLWSPSLLLANTKDNKIGEFHAKSQEKEGMPPVGRRGGLPPFFPPPPSPPPVAQSTGDASHPPPPPPRRWMGNLLALCWTEEEEEEGGKRALLYCPPDKEWGYRKD